MHLVAAPMTHAAGCVAFPLLAMGATQVVIPRRDPLEIMRCIEQHKRHHAVPAADRDLHRCWRIPACASSTISSLEHFIYAAAPMSADKLKEAIDVFGPVMAQTFGQAEAPMLCTFLSPHEHLVDRRSRRRRSGC